MTVQIREMSTAIARLGEVVLDPSRWLAAMEEISHAAGATGAALIKCDIRTHDIPRTEAVRGIFDAYFQGNWHLRDIRARGEPLLIRGVNVVSDQDVLTADEVRASPFYNELLHPFGLPWFAAIGFPVEATHWAVAIYRNAREGPFEKAEKRALEQLSARFSDAATLSSAVGRAVLSGATNALELCGQAALVMDRTGFVLNINAWADQLFDNEIYLRNKQLIIKDARARSNLENLIAWLRSASEFANVPAKTIIVRKNRGRPVLIRVLPIPPAARAPFLGARVLLTLTPLQRQLGTNLDLLIQTFELTHAEARVAALVGSGATLAVAARQSGVSISTVRNQLKAVFAKTETHRQSELVALTSSLSGP